ncbi:hypothetical protein ABRZ09_09590 [Castellaniella ginsengisoli]|uniref:Uncharacterized protein n=1 Tax=Castellaniella ginsengisoli TaxID=546114 RepID=A0AB39D662_9BURK
MPVGRRIVRQVRHADADRDPLFVGRVWMLLGGFVHRRTDGLRQAPGPFGGSIRQEHHEFLAAVAGHQIGRAGRHRGDHLRDAPQALVAGDVAVVIVVALEIVDVDHQYRQRGAVADCAVPVFPQPLVERQPVGDPRQGILPHLQFQQMLEFAFPPPGLVLHIGKHEPDA